TQDHRPLALARRAHERLIDLDRVEGEPLQIAERGMAGAEVVERQPGAELADAGEHLRGVLRVLHNEGFGELKLERAACQARAGDERTKVMDQVLPQQLS